eukprot:g8611.t1
MAMGSFLCGSISDAFGRKVGVILCTSIIGFVGLLTAFVPNYISLLIARFVVGIGIGGMNNSLSLFAEFQPKDKRGVLMTLYEFGASIGVVLESALAWAVLPNFGWRGLVLVTSFLPILLIFLLIPVPESPRYLVVNGKQQKSYEVLCIVAKINGKVCPTGELYLPHAEAMQTHHPFKKVKQQLQGLFQHPLGGITPVLWAMQFMTGLGYYSLLILTTRVQSDEEDDDCKDGEFSLTDSDYFGFLLSAIGEFVANVLFLFIIDKLGRRKLFTSCFWLYSFFLLPLLFSAPSKLVYLYLARTLGDCMFLIVNIMATEIYPSTCRATGLGMMNICSRIGGGISPFFVLALYDSIGLQFVGAVYSLLYFLAGMLSIFIPFDTLGKPMSDSIDEVLEMYLDNTRSANYQTPIF